MRRSWWLYLMIFAELKGSRVTTVPQLTAAIASPWRRPAQPMFHRPNQHTAPIFCRPGSLAYPSSYLPRTRRKYPRKPVRNTAGAKPLHHHATHQSLLSYQNCPYSLLQVPQKGDRRCDCGRDYSALYVSSRGYAPSCAKDARHGTHTDGGCSTVKTNLFGEGDRSLFPWSDTETDVVESEVEACLGCPSTAQNDKLIDDLQGTPGQRDVIVQVHFVTKINKRGGGSRRGNAIVTSSTEFRSGWRHWLSREFPSSI